MADYTLSYTGAQINSKLAQVETLTEQVNALTTTIASHKKFTFSSQDVTGQAGIHLYCYKYGPLVQITINNTSTAAIAAWGLVGTLPAKYRPKSGIQVFSDNPLNSGQGFYIGDSTGEVRTNAAIANGVGCWTTMTFIGIDD